MKRSRKITAKQEAFANYVASGLPPSESYRRAYNTKGSPAVVSVKAAELKRNPLVAAFITRFQEENRQTRLWERVDKRRLLAQVMGDPDMDTGRKLEAIKIDNAMTGDDAPQKVEVTGIGDLIDLIRKKAPKP
jgi:hypothetical protein